MQVQKNILDWIESKQEEDIITEEIVISKLEKYYSEHFSYEYIPHYLHWTKDNYGVPMKIFHKRYDDEPIPIVWTENQNLSTIIVEYCRRQSAKRTYEDELRKLAEGNPYNNYYQLLSEIISHSEEFLLYDTRIATRIARKRESANVIKIFCKNCEIMENNQNCDWIWKQEFKIFPGGKNEIGTSEEFASRAKAQLQNTSVIFPYKFSNEVTNKNELLLEEHYKDLQMSLIYNDKLRILFNKDSQHNLKLFLYKDACKRLRSLYPELDGYNIEQREEYVYLIEKLTGINLAFTYTKYYTQIKKMLHGTMPNKMIEGVLLGILDDFIDMPNLLTRSQIVKEFMESILFFNDDIMKRLCYLKESTFKLSLQLNAKWKNFNERTNDTNLFYEIEGLSFDIQQKILDVRKSENPFLFIATNHIKRFVSKDFATVFRYTIKRLTSNYNINNQKNTII